MNLLILTEQDALSDGRYRVTGRRFVHMQTVLKSSAGDELEIGLLNGPRGTGKVESIDNDCAIIQPFHLGDMAIPPLTIDLVCAIPRPKILRKVLYVSAMMGVRSVHLVRANRTEKSYLLSPLLEPHNYEPYLIEGLSQGKQTRMPVVELHPLFRPFVEDQLPGLPGFDSSPKVIADLVTGHSLDQAIPGSSFSHLFLGIGPEGGWVDFERDLLAGTGFSPFSLGSATLRVEYALTAALSQLYLVWRQRRH